jgi:hypothetical protein
MLFCNGQEWGGVPETLCAIRENGQPAGKMVEGFGVRGIEMQRSDGSFTSKDGGVVGVRIDFLIAVDALLQKPKIRPAAGVLAFAEEIAGDLFRLASKLYTATPVVRNIDAQEDLLRQLFAQDEFDSLTGKLRGGSEICIDSLRAERHGKTRNAMYGGFACSADGAGVVDVFAQVRAVIDAGDDQVRRRGKQAVQGDDDAVGRSAVDGPLVFGNLMADDGLTEG